MKLSRGSLLIVLIAIIIMLIGVVQVIARARCSSFKGEGHRPKARVSSSLKVQSEPSASEFQVSGSKFQVNEVESRAT
ncbi:MAG TPA: hypothetical protein VMX94_12785 [Armatimonadota bacterium]|nr:hypothetical protein [Armatimonadota bacterium]